MIATGDIVVSRTDELPTFIGDETANKNQRNKKSQSGNDIQKTRDDIRVTRRGSYFG